LADLCGVGRTTVREALRLMEAMGLIAVRPGDGAYLMALSGRPTLEGPGAGTLSSRENDRTLFDLRAALEPGLAAMAARRATQEHVAEMHAALGAQRASVMGGESGIEEAAALHRLIADATGSPCLVDLMRSLMPLWQDTRHPVLWIAHRATRSLRQHEGILAAIEARNPSLAMRRMLVHIRSMERALAAAYARPQPHADAPSPTLR
jgi:GntR family transcriptional repressor for pyruvate dehydrogenase complex